MTSIQRAFEHGQYGEIRTIEEHDTIYFVAKDVCEALGISKYRDAVSRLDDDERGSVLVDTPGGRQSMTAVNESGLYHLIFMSRKQAAKNFRKWVTSEVLPTIRETGRYVVPEYARYRVEIPYILGGGFEVIRADTDEEYRQKLDVLNSKWERELIDKGVWK